jgi:hypothetical protein
MSKLTNKDNKQYTCVFSADGQSECCVIYANNEEEATSEFFDLYPFYHLDYVEQL